MGFLKSEKSLTDLEEENEKLEVELSVAQKRSAIAQLKERGLTPKHFGFNWKHILSWLKEH